MSYAIYEVVDSLPIPLTISIQFCVFKNFLVLYVCIFLQKYLSNLLFVYLTQKKTKLASTARIIIPRHHMPHTVMRYAYKNIQYTMLSRCKVSYRMASNYYIYNIKPIICIRKRVRGCTQIKLSLGCSYLLLLFIAHIISRKCK